MSPEQVGAEALLDARSDIYCVGAVAYFLLTGQSPFAGRLPLQSEEDAERWWRSRAASAETVQLRQQNGHPPPRDMA